jgi:hypothetical protein
MQNRPTADNPTEISDSMYFRLELNESTPDEGRKAAERAFNTSKQTRRARIRYPHTARRDLGWLTMRSILVTLGVAALLAVGISVTATGAATPAGAETVSGLQHSFNHPPDDSRIMVRWWWFGTAVVKPELERELRTMKEGGIGGVEIQPVYPVVLDDPARDLINLPYLSDGFLDAVRFANDKARELGLRVDITLGSGWPYGGPHTTVELASGRLRVARQTVPANAETVPMPKLSAGEKFVAAFDGVHQITGTGESAIRVSAQPNSREIEVFIASKTKQQVKRAAVGAEGPVLDHYSVPAIENHLKLVGDRLMEAFGSHPPYAVFSDSLEVYGSDWTGDFLSEFQKRRGYDLTPYLPALAGEMDGKTATIRHDWGKTLTELANEHYLTPIEEWAKQHGTKFRSQTYGIPPVDLSSNAIVDLPEGEGSQWRQFTPTRWAASASHLYGRPVTSSETFTWLHSPVFRATPLDMKAEADLHFLQGVNQIICHGWPYSPPQAGDPGWHFYAAAVFNNHNPWWLVMPDITAYLQRVSFLLRQGQPDNDVALYLPTDDAYAGFTLGRDSVNQAMQHLLGPNVIPQILDGGYNFDYIDDGAIAKVGIPYRVLVLPNVERMPLASLEKIRQYAAKGGIVIATGRTPSMAPGLMDEKDTPDIRKISAELFAGKRFLRDDSQLAATLRGLCPPDVVTAPEIGVVHRKLPFADIYFLANTSNHAVHHEAVFRIQGEDATWWNPFDGRVTRAAAGNKLDLDLAPYESRVLVFSKEKVPAEAQPASAAGATTDLSTGWKVTFHGTSQPVTMQKLESWTDVPGEKFFSGTATYEKTITVPAGKQARYLDFGKGTPVEAEGRRAGNGMRAMLESPVREAAVVYINGKRAGAVWHPPYRLDVSGMLHAGENTIRIEVANLAINELANEPLPNYKPLIEKYGERFQDQDMQNIEPLPSGILGGVRLIAQ